MHAYDFPCMKVNLQLIIQIYDFLHKASLGKLKTKKGRELLGYNQSIPSTGATYNFLLVSHRIKYY